MTSGPTTTKNITFKQWPIGDFIQWPIGENVFQFQRQWIEHHITLEQLLHASPTLSISLIKVRMIHKYFDKVFCVDVRKMEMKHI